MKKQEVIEMVNQSAGSLFTKQDVLNLIDNIDSSKLSERLTSELISEFSGRVVRQLDLGSPSAIRDYVDWDADSAEFSLKDGDKVNLDDVSVELKSDDLESEIEQSIEKEFEKLKELLEAEEN